MLDSICVRSQERHQKEKCHLKIQLHKGYLREIERSQAWRLDCNQIDYINMHSTVECNKGKKGLARIIEKKENGRDTRLPVPSPAMSQAKGQWTSRPPDPFG